MRRINHHPLAYHAGLYYSIQWCLSTTDVTSSLHSLHLASANGKLETSGFGDWRSALQNTADGLGECRSVTHDWLARLLQLTSFTFLFASRPALEFLFAVLFLRCLCIITVRKRVLCVFIKVKVQGEKPWSRKISYAVDPGPLSVAAKPETFVYLSP